VVSDDRPRVSLDSYRSWFLGLQPEAIGPMLHNLVSEPVAFEGEGDEESKTKNQMLKLQQTSILQCLKWMNESELILPESYRGSKPNRIQRQFEKSTARMNTQGVKPKKNSIVAVRNNIARLDEFMGRKRSTLLEIKTFRKYTTLRNKFSMHLKEHD